MLACRSMPGTKRPSVRPETVVFAVVAILCLLSIEIRWYLCRELPFVMDELVDTQLAVQVARGARLYLDRPFERMPLMTFLLAALHDSGAGSFASMVDARHVFWLLMLLTALGTALLARNLLGWRGALTSLGLLLGFSTFLDRATRVRADGLSTACSLPALIALTAPRLRLDALFAAGFGLGLAWITTQKAIYFVAAFAVALTARHVLEERVEGTGARRRWRILLFLRRAGIATFGFCLPFAGVVLWAARQGGLRQFLQQTLFYGAYVGLSSEVYAYTWTYLAQTLRRNPGFWLLGLLGMSWMAAAVVRSCRKAPREAQAPRLGVVTGGVPAGPALALAAWSLVVVAAILHHTAKFPYVFLMVSPPLAACGAVALLGVGPPLWGPTAPRWRKPVAVAVALALLVALPAAHHARALSRSLILDQKSVMDRVDALTAPDDAVLDGIGMAVARPKATPYSMTARWFVERSHGAPYPVIGPILASRPKVMIRNYRIENLTPAEWEFLTTHFIPDWANLAVVGAVVRHSGPGPSETVVDLLAPARYRVLAADLEQVTVDGAAARATVELAAGAHRVRVEGAPQTVVLRYARSLEVPAPPAREPFSLFPEYSW